MQLFPGLLPLPVLQPSGIFDHQFWPSLGSLLGLDLWFRSVMHPCSSHRYRPLLTIRTLLERVTLFNTRETGDGGLGSVFVFFTLLAPSVSLG